MKTLYEHIVESRKISDKFKKNPLNRLDSTKSRTDIYKDDTPGQEEVKG